MAVALLTKRPEKAKTAKPKTNPKAVSRSPSVKLKKGQKPKIASKKQTGKKLKSLKGSAQKADDGKDLVIAPGGKDVAPVGKDLRTKKFKPKPANPEADPRFKKVKKDVGQKAKKVKTHPPAKQKAGEAAKAAVSPPNERLAGAKANQVDSMKDAKTEKPDPDSFLAVLRAEIEKVMPATVEDADNFMEGGAEAQMKGAVGDNVKGQKETASADLEAASESPPDTAAVPEKETAPIPPESPTAVPSVNGSKAMPAPMPDEDVSQKQTKLDADEQLKKNKLTETRLQKANDPRFSKVLEAKENVSKVADASPGKFRARENAVLVKSGSQAKAAAGSGMTALGSIKGKSTTAVSSRQAEQKKQDEQRRKKVADDIEAIYTQTKQLVDQNLNSLEKDVMMIFDAGASAAISAFKSNSKREIDAFFEDRYGGLFGWTDWVGDLFKPTPPQVKKIIQNNLKAFTKSMDALAVRVANLVDKRLNQAKSDIEKGQTKIKNFVANLPKDLQDVGQQAEKAMSARFDQMREGVEAKKNDLAQKLAQKYKEATDQANKIAVEIEEENAGAFSGLIEAIGAVIKIILEFKDKLMALLRKAADTIELILDDPIGFLGNLIAAIKQGVNQFVSNIWTHLKKGFMQWLFGSLASAGIEIPSDLSLMSIFKLVMGVLGITYERMKAKAVKLLGPTAVAVIEKVVEYIRALITGGPAKLWEMVKEDIGNLKAMVIDAIQSWLIETIVKQATIKLLSFFNPAGAFVQAVMAIYNTVVFLIERASQIMSFVEAIINSVSSIAKGAIGAAATWIEQSLARMIPLVIGFLARLIGLGGISQKIKEFILKVQSKVDKAIDKAIAKVVQLVKKLFGKTTGKGKKDDKRTEKEKQADLKKAVDEGTVLLQNPQLSSKAVDKKLKSIKSKYKLSSLVVVVKKVSATKELDYVQGKINPDGKGKEVSKIKGMETETIDFKCKSSLDLQEFKRQIKMQQEGLINMSIETFLKNREAFFARKSAAKKRGVKNPEGRDPAGAKEMERVKEQSIADLAAELADADKTLTPMQARKQAEKQMEGKVPLHRIDQIAGGEGEDIGGMGGERENYSIGAAWRSRARKLEAKIKNLNLPEDIRKSEKLKVKLTVNGS